MNPRQAVKTTLRFFLQTLVEEERIPEMTDDELDNAIESIHADDQFLESLTLFLEDYINDFGENYGIE